MKILKAAFAAMAVKASTEMDRGLPGTFIFHIYIKNVSYLDYKNVEFLFYHFMDFFQFIIILRSKI